MKNKKGQDLSIGTLILIVLGIVVLVLLILGFTLGWDNLWEKVNIFGGSSIGTVVNACKLSVTSQDSYTFCEKTWKVTLDNGKKVTMGCRDDKVVGVEKNAFSGCEGYSSYEDILSKANEDGNGQSSGGSEEVGNGQSSGDAAN